MLDILRKRVASIFVKFLLIVLALSFVLWGISDVFSPGRSGEWLAKVGDTTISSSDYSREYRQSIQRLNRTFGQNITDEQARALGLPNTVVNQLITRALLDEASADLGVLASDRVVRAAIAADPNFRNAVDQFDADLFRQLLAASGMSEQAYVDLLRREIARNQLVNGISAIPDVPGIMTEMAYRYANEKRSAQYVRVPQVPASDIAPPDDDALRKFQTEREAQFTTPELRAVSAIVLSAEKDIVPTIDIPEDEVRAIYEERAEELGEPELRSFQQMVFSDEPSAQQALERLRAGETFASVAATMLGSGPETLGMTGVAASDLPPDLAEVVFDLETDEISEPTQTPLGWHIVRVISVIPGKQPLFEAVAETIRKDIARDLATDTLIDRGNKLDDILGSGATLEQAAGELGLRVRTIPAIDAQGNDASGNAIEDLPEGFAVEAFETAEGTQSLLREAGDDVYFVLRVDAITPPALIDFETVREEIGVAWQNERREELTRSRAEELAEDISGGSSIATVAQSAGLDVHETSEMTRDTIPEANLPPDFVAGLFSVDSLGKSFVVPGADGYYVGALKAILQADPASDSAGVTAVEKSLAESIRNDIVQQYLASLRQKYPVDLNRTALTQIM